MVARLGAGPWRGIADLLLFGGFLAWAVADRISYKHCQQRPLKGAPPAARNDVIVVIVGLAIYAHSAWPLRIGFCAELNALGVRE
jgi:hypothetical protein